MPSSHSTIPTPNPRERSLIVQVEESVFVQDPDILPAYDTRYEDCDRKIFAHDYNKKFNDYVYRDQVGDHGMLFVKTKTPEERNTQIKPSQQVTERVDWDAVTQWIQFGQETGFPLSQNTINGQGKQAIVTAPRWLVPRGYQPGQSLMTVVTVKEFLSEVPWADFQMQSDEPQPTEVMWDLVGSHGTTGRCLHPKVQVPAQATAGYRVVTTAGDTQSANSSAGKGWIFPQTNHKKRQDFMIVDVKYSNGQYYRKESVYHVPVPMSKIVQESRPI